MIGDPPAASLIVPTNIPAERAVLAAVLAAPESLAEARAIVAVRDFADDRHGTIFSAMLAVMDRGGEPDLVQVAADLDRAGKTKGAGGVAYLSELGATELPDIVNTASYAALIADAARRREAQRLALELARDAGNGGGDLAELATKLAAALDRDPARAGANGWQSIGIDFSRPPAPRRWLLTAPALEGERGVLPLAKVGLLAAEGGTGKTSALVALAVAVATGRRWFGHFTVPPTIAGRVCLLLAEEDGDDVQRKLWTIARTLGLSVTEEEAVARRVVAIPLAGEGVALTGVFDGAFREAPLAASLRRRLERDAGPDGWSLIAVDPLARFAGGDVEGSNEAATGFVEVLEELTHLPGSPTVLTAAHSSKLARRLGVADVRGVTALSDGARWVATLQREHDDIIFRVVKSNYGAPGEPLRLRWQGEMLAAVSAADVQAAAQAEQSAALEAAVARVVAVLQREGRLTSRDGIAKAAGLRASDGRAALDLAVARGLVIRDGLARGGYVVNPSRPPSRPPSLYIGRDGGTVGSGCPSGTATGRLGTAGREDDKPDNEEPPEHLV